MQRTMIPRMMMRKMLELKHWPASKCPIPIKYPQLLGNNRLFLTFSTVKRFGEQM